MKGSIISKKFISITGVDSIDFLQNIISNDIKKVTDNNSIFASLLTPQGKLLFEFIILKTKNIFLIECNNELIKELFNKLYNYKLRSKVEIKIENDLVSIDIPFEKFKSLNVNKLNLINYKNYLIFEDPRIKNTLARAIIKQYKIKEFFSDLNIEQSDKKYFLEKKLFDLGIPSKDIQKLQNQLFSLEANFLELNGIDQKKVKEEQKITLNNDEIGKVLINDLFPFGLIKINKENKNLIIGKELKTETASIKINIPDWMLI
jgi:folate-binding Fe-S cluster repair protein YgfZ